MYRCCKIEQNDWNKHCAAYLDFAKANESGFCNLKLGVLDKQNAVRRAPLQHLSNQKIFSNFQRGKHVWEKNSQKQTEFGNIDVVTFQPFCFLDMALRRLKVEWTSAKTIDSFRVNRNGEFGKNPSIQPR